MRIFSKLLFCAAFAGASFSSFAQDLQIFGFMQPLAINWDENITLTQKVKSTPIALDVNSKTELPKKYNSFSVQQANIMARNDFGNGFSAFINLELTNNYSSSQGWGDLQLQEAFVRYEYSNFLKAKVGLFIPTFNNMYEIYNRTPILPFIFRPYVYEPMLKSFVDNSDFLPQRAFAQIDGVIPVGDANIDYALYIGNVDNSFFENSKTPIATDYTPVNGNQLTKYISVGGRIGARISTLKAGVSFVQDRNNLSQLKIDPDFGVGETVDFGAPVRYKIGADLSYSIEGFTLLAEYIQSSTKLSSTQKDSLNAWSQLTTDLSLLSQHQRFLKEGAFSTNNIDASFMFASLQYDITDKLYAYGTYSRLANNKILRISDDNPIVGIGGGLGFRASDQVVVKLQYQNTEVKAKEKTSTVSTLTQAGKVPVTTSYALDYKSDLIMFGVSVAF